MVHLCILYLFILPSSTTMTYLDARGNRTAHQTFNRQPVFYLTVKGPQQTYIKINISWSKGPKLIPNFQGFLLLLKERYIYVN